MMQFSLALLLLATALTDGDRELIAGIHNAFEANREALDAHGDVTFEFRDGMVVGTSDPHEQDFERFERTPMSFGEGRYLFAPPNRLYDHALTLEQLRRVNVRTGPQSWSSPIPSYRQITDGEAILGDTVFFTDDESDYRHTLSLSGKMEFFFKIGVTRLKLSGSHRGASRDSSSRPPGRSASWLRSS